MFAKVWKFLSGPNREVPNPRNLQYKGTNREYHLTQYYLDALGQMFLLGHSMLVQGGAMTNICNPTAERQENHFSYLLRIPSESHFSYLFWHSWPKFWIPDFGYIKNFKLLQTFTLYSYWADTPIPITFNPIWVIRWNLVAYLTSPWLAAGQSPRRAKAQCAPSAVHPAASECSRETVNSR